MGRRKVLTAAWLEKQSVYDQFLSYQIKGDLGKKRAP